MSSIMSVSRLKPLTLLLACLLLVPLAGYLGLLLINSHDRPLASRLATYPERLAAERALMAEDNAALYLAGIGASRDGDPHSSGRKWMAWALLPDDRRGRVREPLTEETPLAFRDHDMFVHVLRQCRHQWREPFDSRACLGALESNSQTVAQGLADHQWALARYRRLVADKPEWWEPPPSPERVAPWPRHAHFQRFRELSMVSAWQQASRGGFREAIEGLEQDARFWRGVLARSSSLVVSATAIHALESNLLWTDLVHREILRRGGEYHPSTWARPLTAEERSLSRAITAEIVLLRRLSTRGEVVAYLRNAGFGILAPLLGPLYQPNDTANRHLEAVADVEAIFAMPHDQLEDARERLARLRNERQGFSWGIYNPTGRFLLRNFDGALFDEYFLRSAELEDRRRALNRVIALRNNGVAPVELEARGGPLQARH